ncbi:hypothetical protein DVH24_013511 [Malus domestica]|uniref:Uncharacterized protein n=1 Tax=Malus domestica TaxID=3750 RepID=A0A498HMJ3_MALDO|nr:hypothetical protein DVH24_013511 [Malus domestica]
MTCTEVVLTVKLYLHNPLPIFFPILKYGSSVLDGQEWISSGIDECDEAVAGDEVDHAGGYGGIVGFPTL